MAMVNRTPILAVPRWVETERLPKDRIVVSALKATARGVLVRSIAIPVRASRDRMTK